MDRATYLQQLHARFALPAEIITGSVERITGRRLVARRRLISGDENEVHRIELDDGSVTYLRATFPGTALSKYDHEAAAMAQAGRHGVPVPDVLGLETLTTADGPRAAMLLAAARGRQLASLLPDLSAEQRRMIMTDLGRVLGIMHSIAMPGVGRPDEQEIGPIRSMITVATSRTVRPPQNTCRPPGSPAKRLNGSAASWPSIPTTSRCSATATSHPGTSTSIPTCASSA